MYLCIIFAMLKENFWPSVSKPNQAVLNFFKSKVQIQSAKGNYPFQKTETTENILRISKEKWKYCKSEQESKNSLNSPFRRVYLFSTEYLRSLED